MISYERVRQKLVFVPQAVYSYGNGKRLARRLVPTAVQFIGHTLLLVPVAKYVLGYCAILTVVESKLCTAISSVLY
jgi:hypothetical protein